MSPVRIRFAFLLGLLLAVGVRPAPADDVGITSARLIELGNGGYALEADVSPRLVAALRPPVVPERFVRVGKPKYRRVGAGLVVRYEFGAPGQSLEAGDVLLLPWSRSAVLLTAHWRDGSAQRGMFPRDIAFIPIPIEVLKPSLRTEIEVARQHLAFGASSSFGMVMRGLFVLGLVAAAGGGIRRSLQLFLMFSGGHAMSLAAIDVGVPTIPPPLAISGIGLAAVLLARSALRQDQASFGPLLLAVGLVDGLGVATRIIAAGLEPRMVVPALFAAHLGLDLVLVIATLLVATLWRAGRGLQRGLATTAGSLAVAGIIATLTAGLSSAAEARSDPADLMAAARLDVNSGAGVGGAGGRATPPPRRLEESAMVFLTVEPMEVRTEVLLRLQDFLGPLGIAGGSGSIVPVQFQGDVATRAKQLVASTISLTIDGREAVPLLERTEFVTVAATGVTTRSEPVPEPVDTSVLGVTLIFGVDRPPGEVLATWRVFPSPLSVVPAVWADPTGSELVELTPEQPVLRWANDLTSFKAPPVQRVNVQPHLWPLASILLLALALAASLTSLRKRLGNVVAYSVLWPALLGAVALYPFARTAVSLPGVAGLTPSRAEAIEIVDGLLTNIYRSFDLRDEEAIYDRLDVSVTGDQLSEVYLKNRRALELENRGGARARVDEVDVLAVPSVRRASDGGFRVEATWTVSGSVNHFGHVHYRQNRYNAEIDLIAVDGVWKIRGLEIRDERRVL